MDCDVSWVFRDFVGAGADYRPFAGSEGYGGYPPSDLLGVVFGDGHWGVFVVARRAVLGAYFAVLTFGAGGV